MRGSARLPKDKRADIMKVLRARKTMKQLAIEHNVPRHCIEWLAELVRREAR